MGLMDLLKSSEEIERNTKITFELVAKWSFERENFDQEKQLSCAKGKEREVLQQYLFGKKVHIPLFAKEWVALPADSPEEFENAIIEFARETNTNIDYVREYAQKYENFIEWLNDENFTGDFLPICTECGAVITSEFEICPCCGKALYGDESQDSEEEISESNFCSSCGTKLESGSKFCSNCGKATR